MLQEKLNLSAENPFFGKWNHLVNVISSAFRLTEKERIILYKSRIARLIAAIPYIADCEDKERTAVSHLGTYILTIRTNNIFDCKPSDTKSMFQRIRMINNFIGGDLEVVNRGLNLLILNIISDYARDIDEDIKLGKYNPITAGVWCLKEEKRDIIKKIKAVKCRYMDEVMSVDQAQIDWWL